MDANVALLKAEILNTDLHSASHCLDEAVERLEYLDDAQLSCDDLAIVERIVDASFQHAQELRNMRFRLRKSAKE